MKLLLFISLMSLAYGNSNESFINISSSVDKLTIIFGDELKDNNPANVVFNFLKSDTDNDKEYVCNGGASAKGNSCSNKYFTCETFGGQAFSYDICATLVDRKGAFSKTPLSSLGLKLSKNKLTAKNSDLVYLNYDFKGALAKKVYDFLEIPEKTKKEESTSKRGRHIICLKGGSENHYRCRFTFYFQRLIWPNY